jgi:histone H4
MVLQEAAEAYLVGLFERVGLLEEEGVIQWVTTDVEVTSVEEDVEEDGEVMEMDENEDESVCLLEEEEKVVVEAVVALVEAGCSLDVQDQEGNTALHLAVRYGKSKVAKSLVAAGCSLDVQDKEGKTALAVAVANPRKRPVERMEEVERVIRAGNTTLDLQSDGKTVLVEEGNKEGGGKGLVKGDAKSHDKVLRDNIQGITEPAIRRLAHRGGMKRISGLIYEPTRSVLKQFLENVIRDAVTYTDHARRKTVTTMDVVDAIKVRGRTLTEIYSYHLTECAVKWFVRKSGRRM